MINILTILPQPYFTTLVGGVFSSGDAGKVATERATRSLWGAASNTDAPASVVAGLLGYYGVNSLQSNPPHALMCMHMHKSQRSLTAQTDLAWA